MATLPVTNSILPVAAQLFLIPSRHTFYKQYCILKEGECVRIPLYYGHFFDYFDHTSKQIDYLLGLRSIYEKKAIRFILHIQFPSDWHAVFNHCYFVFLGGGGGGGAILPVSVFREPLVILLP